MQPIQPTPPADPRHPRFWRFAQHPGGTLLLGLLSLFAAEVVVAAILKVAGLDAQERPTPPSVASLQLAAVVGAYLAIVRDLERRRPVELSRRGAGQELGAGLLGGLLLFSAVVGAMAALGGYRVTGRDPAFALGPVLMVGIVPGVGEEIVFRGLLFRLLEAWLGSWPALALSAALFGAVHLGNAHASPFAAVAISLEAGVMLGAVYMLTRRLWAAIGVHAAWNMTQGGLWGVPVSGGAMHGLLLGRLAGPAWLTGGAFGAEASVPATVIAGGAGVVLLAVCARRGRIVPSLPRRRRG